MFVKFLSLILRTLQQRSFDVLFMFYLGQKCYEKYNKKDDPFISKFIMQIQGKLQLSFHAFIDVIIIVFSFILFFFKTRYFS